jgi:hypothetical protein
MTTTTTGRSSTSGASGSAASQDSIGGEKLQQAAGDLADQAGRTAEAKASTAMDQLGQALDQVAQAAREAGDSLRSERPELAGVAETAADKVTDVSRYLREHEAREVIATAEDAARRQPALVIAGGFALGLLTARLLRSAAPSTGGSGYRPTWHSGSDWYASGGSSGYSRSMRGRTGMGAQLTPGDATAGSQDDAASAPGYSSAPYAGGSAGTAEATGSSRRATSAGTSAKTGGTPTSPRQSMSASTKGEES